jgi:RHS repeat-associated protein
VAKQTYDDLGRLETTTDARTKTTRYLYDQLGRVAKVTAPNDGETKLGYDLVGDQTSVADPTGAVSTATYDYLHRKKTFTQVVRQDNKNYTTEYGYGPGGWLASVTSPLKVVSSTTYNAAGEPRTVTDGAGNVTTYQYDGAGRRVRTTLPDNTYRTVTYDLAGRPSGTASYNATGTLLISEATGYDAGGHITSSTDARQTTATFGYDAAGHLTSEVQPISASDSIRTTFGYDAAGNRTRFTDGRGNPFLTKHNSWNLPESEIEPATARFPDAADRTFTVSYDAVGHLRTQTSPGGVTITNSYDDLGNPTEQVGDGAEVTTVGRIFTYDKAGRVKTASGSAGTMGVDYDDRSLVRTIAGAPGSSSFTYNPDGAMATRDDAAGTTTYGYDTAGRLETVTNPTTAVRSTYRYNSLNQVKTITYGTNGNVRSLGYDDLHRLTADELKTPSATTIAKIEYGYDPNGNEKTKTTTGFGGSTTNTYDYDLADRLTSWTNGTGTTVYAYDKSGNRIKAGATTYTFDERNQLVNSSDGTTYQYTPRGTLKATTVGSGTLETKTDAFGQITSQSAPGGVTRTYTYDGLGRVIRPGLTYTGLDNSLAGDGAAAYTRDPSGGLLGVATATTRTLAWTDLHTDVVGQFTDSGMVLTGSTTYDPFGKVLATSGMLGSLGYQSEWTDPATGRVNMLARWYNPETGEFDTRDTVANDPVPDSVEANRFAYASDNPLTVTDPSGHFSLSGLWNKAKSSLSSGVKAVKSAVTTFGSALVSGAKTAASWVANTYNKTTNWVSHKVEQSHKWVAQKAQEIKQRAKQIYNEAKQVGRTIAAKATRVVTQAVDHVKDAYDATEKWVKEHKNVLIEAAAIAGGVLAGLACTAATAGAGAVACMVGAAALINLAKDAAQGHVHNFGDAFGSVGTGALQGLAGGVGGIVGGKIAGLVVGKLGGLAGTVAGRMLGGAITGGVGDAVAQYATTGRVTWGGVATSAGIGAVFGGFAKGRINLKQPSSSAARGGHVTATTGARFVTGGDGVATDTRPDLQSLARTHADEVLANRVAGRRPPTAVAAAYDQVAGTVHFGESGSVPAEIHPELRANMPDPSLEPWAAGNCAEFNACNNALHAREGAELKDLTYGTVRTKKGTPFESCQNCTASLQGAKEDLG